jgi:hypothetical protein
VTSPKKSSSKSDTPGKVSFTLEEIEAETADDAIEPLRISVRGKVMELKSPLDMEIRSFEDIVAAMSADQDSLVGDLGEAGAMLRLFPAMIGEENFQTLKDAHVTLPVMMALFQKVQEYYGQAMEQLGADPKDSTSE